MRPAPTMPHARSPVPGSMTRTPRWRRISRLALVAGCSHMFTFIAGATSTGARGRQIHRGQKIVGDAMRKLGQNIRGRRSHDQRLGPLRLADVFDGGFVAVLAGAGFIPEAGDHLVSGECGEGERLHKAVAASVITTCTSSAWRCSARTSSAALYAAMPPETPTVTRIARL